MQRVLHVTGTMDRGGAESMIMNLYREIDRSKIQFDFVFFSNKEADYEDEINNLGGKIHRILESNPIKRMLALKKLLQTHPEYNIVHSHTLLNSGFNLWGAKLAGVPNRIAHAHSTNDLANKRILGKLYKRLSLKMISKFTTSFISCGREASNFLFPRRKDVLILPNSINTEEFAAIGESHREYIKKEFKLDEHILKILQVGRLNKVKNHKFSIAIARRLKEKETPFKMFFIGQGELYNEINDQIKEYDLTKEVILLGLRTDIPQLMAGADVMLMPSLHEGFPVVLVESQAVGLPAIIASTIATEVDIEVNLVDFLKLEDAIDTWIEKIEEVKLSKRLNNKERLNVMEQKGFNVKSNAVKLTSIYNSMH